MIFGKKQESTFDRYYRIAEHKAKQASNDAQRKLLIAAQKGYSKLPLSTRIKNIDTVSLTGYIFVSSALAILIFSLSMRSIIAIKKFKELSNETKKQILANETNVENKKILFTEYETKYTTQLTFIEKIIVKLYVGKIPSTILVPVVQVENNNNNNNNSQNVSSQSNTNISLKKK